MKPDRWERCDALYSSFVAVADHSGTRFYIDADGLYTDVLDRALVYPYLDQAEEAAEIENRSDVAYPIRGWRPMLYVQAMNERITTA